MDANELMDAAYKTLHSCDLCGAIICEHFDKSDGIIHPGQFIDDLWLCEICAKHETQ